MSTKCLILGCGPPPVVENAAPAVYSATLLGSTASYTCNAGFGIRGSVTIKCLSEGWESEPQCVTGDLCLNSFVTLLPPTV